jgi:hypothetical protein
VKRRRRKSSNDMEKLNKTIAHNIVSKAIAVDTSLKRTEIRGSSSIVKLQLDSQAKERIYRQIVGDIESVGYVPKFSTAELFKAKTVGEIINIVIALTESGGPE